MNVNKSKIRCPKCGTVYSIESGQNDIAWRKSARCIVCESRFFVEYQASRGDSEEIQEGVVFLKTYFEKRGIVDRRRVNDRRKEIKSEYLTEFQHDVIPIFNDRGNVIIGHISPGRRQKTDRRSGIDRRQYLVGQDNREEGTFTEYRVDS
ncbi:MAG: hypothetical protein JW944_09225 [Deltaproteobacteria bacterium]|nr:hypothetical protein [Deltaproteobacteria bacterium]